LIFAVTNITTKGVNMVQVDPKDLEDKNTEENVTRHSATSPDKCEEMEQKYGWKLNRWEENDSSILEVDCVFDGEAEFPKSRMDYTGDDDDE